MQIKIIIQEIQQLPLDERFLIVEQTWESIKNEELKQPTKSRPEDIYDNYENDKKFRPYSISKKSLASDWLSEEDNRWDNLL